MVSVIQAHVRGNELAQKTGFPEIDQDEYDQLYTRCVEIADLVFTSAGLSKFAMLATSYENYRQKILNNILQNGITIAESFSSTSGVDPTVWMRNYLQNAKNIFISPLMEERLKTEWQLLMSRCFLQIDMLRDAYLTTIGTPTALHLRAEWK